MSTREAEYDGWPETASSLVERAIERHGGREAWDRHPRLDITFSRVGGFALIMKGVGRTGRFPTRLVIDPARQRTEYPGFPQADAVTIVADGAVIVADLATGHERERHPAYRQRFSTLAGQLRPWSDLDAAYFLGYSQANYHAYPFVLPRLTYCGERSYAGDGGTWHALTLEYQPGEDCHSRRQVFHFDPTALLRRVDYSVEIVGRGSSSTHFYNDYVRVAGILFPSRRRIRARVLGMVTPIPLIVLDASLVALPPADTSAA